LLDSAEVIEPDAPGVRAGTQYVMFLDLVTDAESPGLTTVGDVYVPVTGTAGMFPISDGFATAPRMGLPGADRFGPNEMTGAREFSVSEIREAARRSAN